MRSRRWTTSFALTLICLAGCAAERLATNGEGLETFALDAGRPPILSLARPDCEEPAQDVVATDDFTAAIEPSDRWVRTLAEQGRLLSPVDTTDTLRIELPIASAAIRATGGRSYAAVTLDRVRIQVINRDSPRERRDPADLVLDVGDRALDAAPVIATLERTTSGVRLRSVSAGTTQIASVPPALHAALDCTSRAIASISAPFPSALTSIQMPAMTGDCSDDECFEIRAAWIRAYVALWYARQSIEYLANLHPQQRHYAWERPGRDASGDLTSATHAPAYYFGPYSEGRFSRVRTAFQKLWRVFRDAETLGSPLRHRCPPSSDAGNVCFTVEPGAQHVVIGQINFCPRFFDTDAWNQARLAAHESAHHLSAGGRVLRDNYVHGHGVACLANLESGETYGLSEVHHFASYRNANGGDCNHADLATRIVDSYAQFVAIHGRARWSGEIATWPAWADPTPQPPEDCTPGDLDCTCDTLWASGENRYPDGDYSVSQVCPDHEGDTVCARTYFGANSVGVCTLCEGNDRANGCTCEDHDDCASNHCWGTDTQDGRGIGRCYEASPPSWVCLPDCKALFNDQGAWCDANYLGGARCMDSGCSAPEADACRRQNRVCIDSQCVVECDSHDDCAELGYPETFLCQNNGCQRPDWL